MGKKKFLHSGSCEDSVHSSLDKGQRWGTAESRLAATKSKHQVCGLGLAVLEATCWVRRVLGDWPGNISALNIVSKGK